MSMVRFSIATIAIVFSYFEIGLIQSMMAGNGSPA